jgi:CspA family cold shock protein
MPRGVVKWFDTRKGFGFIKGSEDGQDVFVHYSSIDAEGFRRLKDGDTVEYELVVSEKGPQAHHIRRVEPTPPAGCDPGA